MELPLCTECPYVATLRFRKEGFSKAKMEFPICTISIFPPVAKCEQVDWGGRRWAGRFEKIPICQISTATSGPDSPSPPTEISLVGGCEFSFGGSAACFVVGVGEDAGLLASWNTQTQGMRIQLYEKWCLFCGGIEEEAGLFSDLLVDCLHQHSIG